MQSKFPLRLVTAQQDFATYDPDEHMRANVRKAMSVLGALGLFVVVGMVLVPIGGAVVTAGQVGVESRVKRIAHPTGGVVAQILVANGDHVTPGQPLVRLEGSVTGAENQFSNLTVEQLLAQRARLDAERMGQASIQFPQELLVNSGAGAQAAMASELRLFRTKQTEASQYHAQFAARIAQYNKQINGFEGQIAALRKQQALIAPERAGVKELWDKGLVTISRLNQLERTSADMEGSIASLESEIAQAEARISETQEQILTMEQTRRAESGAQFATVSNTINEQQVKRVAAGEADRHSVVRAPYAGVIDKLVLTAVGDVVRPGEPFMEIVPDKDRFIVEVMVSPNDIDQIHAGQQARVKFTAFNSTATPEIGGKLAYVAPERTLNADTKAAYYEARVEIDIAELRRHPEMALKPGMPAEVFVQTGSRSMISYLTKPLRDQLARAFKDN